MAPAIAAGPLLDGRQALQAARWDDARAAFEESLAVQETPDAIDGLGRAFWFQNQVAEGIAARERAFDGYARERRCDEAARVAVWVSHRQRWAMRPRRGQRLRRPCRWRADVNDWAKRDFLVFEATGEPVPAYTCFFTEHTCIGHVRAADETAAAKVVTGVTGRVRRYAVVEVTMVDLAGGDLLGGDIIADVGDTPHRAP